MTEKQTRKIQDLWNDLLKIWAMVSGLIWLYGRGVSNYLHLKAWDVQDQRIFFYAIVLVAVEFNSENHIYGNCFLNQISSVEQSCMLWGELMTIDHPTYTKQIHCN